MKLSRSIAVGAVLAAVCVSAGGAAAATEGAKGSTNLRLHTPRP